MIIEVLNKEYEVEVTKIVGNYIEFRGINGKGMAIAHLITGKGRFHPSSKTAPKILNYGHAFSLSKKTLELIQKEIHGKSNT